MKTAVVTGANRGIGLELCRQLVEKDYHVAAVCRRSSDALASLAGDKLQVVDGVDITDYGSFKEASNRIGRAVSGGIDLLINNAGILERTSLDNLDADSVRRQFEVNALAPVMFTRSLLELMSSQSKLAFITSRMGSIDDNTSGGSYGYRMSKAALNIAAVSLARDLEGQVAVAILHPGWVKTDMTGHSGQLTPEESARGLLERIDGLNGSNSGTFWHSNGEVLPW